MYTLYDRIVAQCKAKNVTPSRMCLDLGLSKSTMSGMKNGRTKGISTPTAKKMAAYFDVPVGYLLVGEEDLDENEEKPTDYGELSESEQALIDLFRQVPADQQELVLQMISVAVGKKE